jgi:hypothetical protein
MQYSLRNAFNLMLWVQVCQRNTWKHAQKLLRTVPDGMPVALLGNFLDAAAGARRAVSAEEVKAVARAASGASDFTSGGNVFTSGARATATAGVPSAGDRVMVFEASMKDCQFRYALFEAIIITCIICMDRLWLENTVLLVQHTIFRSQTWRPSSQGAGSDT